MPRTVAALFVAANGCYFGVPGVDPWDEVRDARGYNGPHPVICHSPCARWGRYWRGSPSGKGDRFDMPGQDQGCFQAAVGSVRRWGGVLEHPRHSLAWGTFGLPPPIAGGGWRGPDMYGGYACQVDQGHYGHRAPKPTWLYVCGLSLAKLPELNWGPSEMKLPPQEGTDTRGRGTRSANDAIERMGRRERLATPLPFRNLLLDIARRTSQF